MVFNSLGSNYNFKFVVKTLFSIFTKENEEKLINYLETRYSGKAILLYKGREAINLALTLLKLPKNSKVGVTGFTCFVVYQAIKEAGYCPEYLDIDTNSLNFSVEEVKKHKGIKVLIVQNTLGDVCDIENIKKYCDKESIYLIEDLAHSAGLTYDNGQEAGSVGDFSALSFSQDKSIDAVSGGALIIRNKLFYQKMKNVGFKKITPFQNIKNKLYPLLTLIIRNSYPLKIGKILHVFLKKINLLSRPVEGISPINFHKLPCWNSGLVLDQFLCLEFTLKHRKRICGVYQKNFHSKYKGVLRWPVKVEKRKELIKFMKKKDIYISDTWYDAPVAPFKLLGMTDYVIGSCPKSEYISKRIINLPTHINVSVNEAERISKAILKWQGTK